MFIDNFLENLSEYKGRLGSLDVKESVNNWINNFKYFNFNNIDILYTLLNNIKFVYDCEIIESFNKFISESNIDYKTIFLNNFGIKDESSYRIIKQINNKIKTSFDIHELLHNVKDSSKLYFVDDFLVSGGQFISIIKSFFSDNDNRIELNLSKSEIDIFRKINKIFFFYKGTEAGLKKANEILQYYKLEKSSRIEVVNKFIIDKTLFGNIVDNKVKNIQESIFFNCATKKEIENFYEILKFVGGQLLKQNKPHWTDERINNSFLGYGNSGQLIFGEHNVPTCTLTSLWMGGDIIFNGKSFKWQPLVFRKEKKLIQTEHISYS
ncbi:MAG TPA: hypothetical protein VLL98_04380 [Rickettsiales bacterium]|nr:hypothetical protein [Rickettsiales bacterium]